LKEGHARVGGRENAIDQFRKGEKVLALTRGKSPSSESQSRDKGAFIKSIGDE